MRIQMGKMALWEYVDEDFRHHIYANQQPNFLFHGFRSLLHFALHNWQWCENDVSEMEKTVKMKSALFMRLDDNTTTTFQRNVVCIFSPNNSNENLRKGLKIITGFVLHLKF